MVVDLRGAVALVMWMGTPLWAVPLAITGQPVTSGRVGETYTIDVEASGGYPAYTYSLVGSWPSGFTIDSTTGQVTGNPTVEGTYTDLSIRVTDSLLSTADLLPFNLTIAPALPALSISGTPVLTATKGSAYAGFTVTASGGTSPYTYSLVGTWPAGLSVNSTTGAVSGTPSVSGTFTSLQVRATDALGATANLTAFTITVAAVPGLLGFASVTSSDPTIPAHVAGNKIITIAARTSTHGGVAPSVTINGANPWELWANLVGGTDRAIAAYKMTATGNAHTVTWANASGQRLVWVFDSDCDFDVIELATYGNGTNVTYPEL